MSGLLRLKIKKERVERIAILYPFPFCLGD